MVQAQCMGLCKRVLALAHNIFLPKKRDIYGNMSKKYMYMYNYNVIENLP